MTINNVKYCFLVILWFFVSFVITLKRWVLYSAGVHLNDRLSVARSAQAIVFIPQGSDTTIACDRRPAGRFYINKVNKAMI